MSSSLNVMRSGIMRNSRGKKREVDRSREREQESKVGQRVSNCNLHHLVMMREKPSSH